MVNGLPEDFIYKQVIKSKEIIEIKIKKDIHCFCWVGGEEYSYGKEVFKKVSENYNFNNLLLDTNTQIPIYIDEENCDWNDTYYWRVRSIYDDNSYGNWIGSDFLFLQQNQN